MNQVFDAHDRGIRTYVARYIDSLPDSTGKVIVYIPCGYGHSSFAFARKAATLKKPFDLYPEFMLESDFWRRSAPTELDSVWYSGDESDRMGFGHLFRVGVQRLQTMATLSGFEVTQRIRTNFGNTPIALGVLRYPVFAMASLFAFLVYRRKIIHVDRAVRDSIPWRSVKLKLSPITLFCKQIFRIMRKTKAHAKVVADMKVPMWLI